MTKREQQEKLFCAIGFVGDDLIARADAPVEKQKSNLVWVKWAALAACCVLVIGLAARLPLGNMKSESTASETATMTMDTNAASTTESPAEEPTATEETTEEAAAEEAPAAADQKAGESGSRGETATDGFTTDEALAQALLDTTLGPVKLGMPAEDVRSILGTPKEESDELYVCTDKGDFRYVTWRYNFTNDPNFINDVKLNFVDAGDGLVLNEIMTFGTSDWALSSGLKNGSSVQALLEAYPDAEPGINGSNGEIMAYSVEAGHVRLTFLVENDVITNISLGTYYEEPGWTDDVAQEAAPSCGVRED